MQEEEYARGFVSESGHSCPPLGWHTPFMAASRRSRGLEEERETSCRERAPELRDSYGAGPHTTSRGRWSSRIPSLTDLQFFQEMKRVLRRLIDSSNSVCGEADGLQMQLLYGNDVLYSTTVSIFTTDVMTMMAGIRGPWDFSLVPLGAAAVLA